MKHRIGVVICLSLCTALMTSAVLAATPEGDSGEAGPWNPTGRILEEALLPGNGALGLLPSLGIEAAQPVHSLPQEAPPQEAAPDPRSSKTFTSVADTCILEGYPTRNSGTTADMWVGYDESSSPTAKTARSLVRFDLSSIAGSSVTSAKLRLYLVNSWDYPDETRTVTTYRIPTSWTESGVNWSNAPQPAEAYGAAPVTAGSWRWYEFDVTALVQAWQNGTYPNNGIMVRCLEVAGNDSSRRGFSTREGPYPPELVVECGAAAKTVTPTPTATATARATRMITATATATIRAGGGLLALPVVLRGRTLGGTATPTRTTSRTKTRTPTRTTTRTKTRTPTRTRTPAPPRPTKTPTNEYPWYP